MSVGARLWSSLLRNTCIVLAIQLSGCGNESSPDRGSQASREIAITPVVALARNVWGVSQADFNNDGLQDVFFGGHDGNSQEQPDSIYYGSKNGFERSEFSFPHGIDRHFCAPLDFNSDDYVDLYCTVGAGRGKRSNPNELWINLDGVLFERYMKPFGAEEASSRGRLASALNFDNQNGMDLVTTVWGKRDDDLQNSSMVFRNTGAAFTRVETSLGARMGGRCLSVGDLNGDTYDDIAMCDEKAGGHVFLNTRAGGFEKAIVSPAFKWWRDVQISDVNGDLIEDIVLLGLRTNQQVKLLEIWHGTGDGTFSRTKSVALSCTEPANELGLSVFCSKIAVTDMNEDGYGDIYVSRRLGTGKNSLDGDIEDIIFLGPDFENVLTVPLAQSGMGSHVIAIGKKVVRVNAGEDWPGHVDIISMAPNVVQ